MVHRAVRLDTDSLERLVPEEVRPGDITGEESLRLCLERYAFAGRHARGRRRLDVACGSGYGTRILSDLAAPGERVTALGVDLSEAAIAYASAHYGNEVTEYRVCNAMGFSDAERFDTIVSIETIEHLPDPAGFIDRMVLLLRPGGIFIASVPTTPSVDANPHHLHDFSERSFRGLFARHGLSEVDALRQIQPFRLEHVLTRSEPRMKQIRPNLPAYYLTHPTALLRRVHATLRYGFSNRYLTLALQAPV